MHKAKIIFVISVFLNLFVLYANAQTITGGESDCVICAQFVPDCGPNERLVPQTCKECAHCEPIDNSQAPNLPQGIPSLPLNDPPHNTTSNPGCQKCTFHAQCLPEKICVNSCCEQRYTPVQRKTECVICAQFMPECKPNERLVKQTCKKCAYCEPITKLKPLTKKKACKFPCGSQCCQFGQKCLTVDQCKGKKPTCKLPILKYCSKTELDPLSGRLIEFN